MEAAATCFFHLDKALKAGGNFLAAPCRPRSNPYFKTSLRRNMQMTPPELVQKNLTQKRQPAQLAGQLDPKLFAYTVAASAACAGMIAACPSVEAEVIATPASIPVLVNGGLVQFDINRDGVADFGLSWRSGVVPPHHKTCGSSCPPATSYRLKVVPAQPANEVWQTFQIPFGGSSYCAAALGAGRRVGPNSPFSPGDKAMFAHYAFFGGIYTSCPWLGPHPPDPYLGVKFLDASNRLHYGWVRFKIDSAGVTVTGYAFETLPNVPINTGVTHGPLGDAQLNPEGFELNDHVPASLGMLALGAPGLAAWRKEKKELQHRPGQGILLSAR
jgi:hypothetical protein